MKSIKVIISILAIVAILVTVLVFSGSAQVLLEKLTGTSQDGNNELPENPDIEDGGSNLVWSENFKDCIFHQTTDTDGTLIYTTDNYLAFYSDGTETDVCEVSVDGDNSFLKIKVNETSDLYLKPRLNLAVDFTKNFNKEHLTLSKSKYIVMRFDIALPTEDSIFTNDLYFRYKVSNAFGGMPSVISSSLKFSDGKIQDKYDFPADRSVSIISFIDVAEKLEESDLYFYIDELDQSVVFEDFLKSDEELQHR